MARGRQRTFVKLTTDELNKKNAKELKAILKDIGKVATERAKYAVKASAKKGIETSPVIREWEKAGSVPFGRVRGKSIDDLRKEYKRTALFLDAPTSKMQEWERVRKDTMAVVAEEINKKKAAKAAAGEYLEDMPMESKLTDKQFDPFFEAYQKLKELDSSVTEKQYKYTVFEAIDERLAQNMDPKQIAVDVYKQLDKLYKKSKGKNRNVKFSRSLGI